VLELDKSFWRADLTPAPLDEWARTQRDLAGQTNWIMDGDLGPYDQADIRLRAADSVIMIDFSRARRTYRALRRTARTRITTTPTRNTATQTRDTPSRLTIPSVSRIGEVVSRSCVGMSRAQETLTSPAHDRL
jgi:hypothetical protein